MMAPETVVTVDLNKPAQQQAPPQQQQGGALDWIKINVDYFKSPPGLLKILQLVIGKCVIISLPTALSIFIKTFDIYFSMLTYTIYLLLKLRLPHDDDEVIAQ
ncbi:unnamed protein product [Euphydryas editha]|uniref:Uncharacterized protein n=1 Tax=Euphydryas editha TaxID=104508 RepID=A0AAU9THR8_EUPED|nr:unnamed protein product [Euphydryas editha]